MIVKKRRKVELFTLVTRQVFIPASYPDVSLDMRAKEGGKETTRETSGRSCLQDGGKSNGGPIYNF